MVEGGRLLSDQGAKVPSRVRIPVSPPKAVRGERGREKHAPDGKRWSAEDAVEKAGRCVVLAAGAVRL